MNAAPSLSLGRLERVSDAGSPPDISDAKDAKESKNGNFVDALRSVIDDDDDAKDAKDKADDIAAIPMAPMPDPVPSAQALASFAIAPSPTTDVPVEASPSSSPSDLGRYSAPASFGGPSYGVAGFDGALATPSTAFVRPASPTTPAIPAAKAAAAAKEDAKVAKDATPVKPDHVAALLPATPSIVEATMMRPEAVTKTGVPAADPTEKADTAPSLVAPPIKPGVGPVRANVKNDKKSAAGPIAVKVSSNLPSTESTLGVNGAASKAEAPVKTLTLAEPTPAQPRDGAEQAVKTAEALGHKRVLASGEAHGQITLPELGRIEVRARTDASLNVSVHVQADDAHGRAVIAQHASELRAHVQAEVPNASVHVDRSSGDARSAADHGGSERRERCEKEQADADSNAGLPPKRQSRGRARFVL